MMTLFLKSCNLKENKNALQFCINANLKGWVSKLAKKYSKDYISAISIAFLELTDFETQLLIYCVTDYTYSFLLCPLELFSFWQLKRHYRSSLFHYQEYQEWWSDVFCVSPVLSLSNESCSSLRTRSFVDYRVSDSPSSLPLPVILQPEHPGTLLSALAIQHQK